MHELNKLTVIIPAYNEAVNLGTFLPQLIDHCQQKQWNIILVNDGSTDNTREFFDQFSHIGNLKIIHHKLNKGYGAAIKSGIKVCETEFLITIDADGQHFLEDLDILYQSILTHDADMVVGSRKGQKSSSLMRGIGKNMIRIVAKMLMTVPIHDLNSGMKIYRTCLAKKCLSLTPDSMAYSDTIALVFISNKHLVLEELIRIKERRNGRSAIGIQTAFQTIMEIINILILFNPLKVFLPLSLICIVLAAIWGIPLLLEGRGLSIGSLLGIISGLIFFLLGLITEQLSLIRRKLHD
jgi:glycosyltransferase involved in cell wall biosynthesis